MNSFTVGERYEMMMTERDIVVFTRPDLTDSHILIIKYISISTGCSRIDMQDFRTWFLSKIFAGNGLGNILQFATVSGYKQFSVTKTIAIIIQMRDGYEKEHHDGFCLQSVGTVFMRGRCIC